MSLFMLDGHEKRFCWTGDVFLHKRAFCMSFDSLGTNCVVETQLRSGHNVRIKTKQLTQRSFIFKIILFKYFSMKEGKVLPQIACWNILSTGHFPWFESHSVHTKCRKPRVLAFVRVPVELKVSSNSQFWMLFSGWKRKNCNLFWSLGAHAHLRPGSKDSISPSEKNLAFCLRNWMPLTSGGFFLMFCSSDGI